jgi:hypothetical protein
VGDAHLRSAVARRLIVAATLALGIGCKQSRGPSPAVPPDADATVSSESQPPGTTRALTWDEQYRKVGIQVPSFGGFSVDPAGRAVVVLLNPDALPAARAAMRNVFRLGGRFPDPEWHVIQGQYSYIQLADWRDRLIPRLLGVPGVTVIGLDQRRNRVTVGIASDTMRGTVSAALAELGVPASAVIIELRGPIRPT